MARMFGFIGNRSDLGARILEANAAVLSVHRNSDEPLGWGIGFYQAGEILLRRRPLDDRREINLVEAALDLRTDTLIGHVRRASVGALRTENTHPFRYRAWLFAQTGTILGIDRLRERLLASIPEFLRKNVRGETDSELFFYLFLSFLHDSGHLADGVCQPSPIAAALRGSIALVDRLSQEEGFGPNSGDILVTNGEVMLAVHRAGAMGFRVWKGRHDIEDLVGSESSLRRPKIPSVDSSHFTLIATEMDVMPPNWVPVSAQTLVTLTRTEAPVRELLA